MRATNLEMCHTKWTVRALCFRNGSKNGWLYKCEHMYETCKKYQLLKCKQQIRNASKQQCLKW